MVFNFLTSLGLNPPHVEAVLAKPVELFNHVNASTQKVARHVQNWFEAIVVPFVSAAALPQGRDQLRASRTSQEVHTMVKAKEILFLPAPAPLNPTQISKPAANLVTSSALKITSGDFIQAFVENHLHPYLTGTITAETEDKNRPALSTIFLPSYRKKFPSSVYTDDALQEFLLQAYVRECACGMNRNIGHIIIPKIDIAHAKKFYAVLKAAISIDFKGRDFSKPEIRVLADRAFQSIIDSLE